MRISSTRLGCSPNLLVRLALGLALACTATLGLFAHPHTFIETSAEFLFAGPGLSGVGITWVFDLLNYDETVVSDYDLDGNGSLNEPEVRALRSRAFVNLRNHDYFVTVEQNGHSVPVPDAQDFSAQIQDGKMVYSFFLPIAVPKGSTRTDLRLVFDDTTNFVALSLSEANPVTVVGIANDLAISSADRTSLEFTYEHDQQYSGAKDVIEFGLAF